MLPLPSSFVIRHSSLRSLRVIALAYAFVICLLGLSFYWNIKQAGERSLAVQQSYLAGVDDGEAMLRARIVRRIIELQLIEEREAADHIAEEKL